MYQEGPSLTVWVLAVVAILLLGLLSSKLWLEHRRRQQAEIEARWHLAAVARLDRRAAMGQLTASLAHQLNQPIGAILRNSEAASMLLASGGSALGELREIVEDIRKDDKRAAEIIRRMRTLLQKHEPSEEPVDLNDIARETVDFVAADAASRGARVDVDLQKTTPVVVNGDRVHLQQVLLNLVLNGLDATAHVSSEHRRVLVSTTTKNGHVHVSVQDEGAGIPDDAMLRIFEPFFTTKTDGMGMGLSIARSIVEAHNGRIQAENNAGRGATVRFSLPLRVQPKGGGPHG